MSLATKVTVYANSINLKSDLQHLPGFVSVDIVPLFYDDKLVETRKTQ
jgi:hypothetical protein